MPSDSPNAPQADFNCGVCLETCTEPVVTRCGHLFCWSCLDKWLTTSQTQECPVCKGLVRQNEAGDIIPLYGKGNKTQGGQQSQSGGSAPTASPSPPRPSTSAPSATATGSSTPSTAAGSGDSSGQQQRPRPQAQREDAPPRAGNGGPFGGGNPFFGGMRNGGFFLFMPGLLSIEMMFLFGLGMAGYHLLPWRRWIGWETEEQEQQRNQDGILNFDANNQRSYFYIIVALIFFFVVASSWLTSDDTDVIYQQHYSGSRRSSGGSSSSSYGTSSSTSKVHVR